MPRSERSGSEDESMKSDSEDGYIFDRSAYPAMILELKQDIDHKLEVAHNWKNWLYNADNKRTMNQCTWKDIVQAVNNWRLNATTFVDALNPVTIGIPDITLLGTYHHRVEQSCELSFQWGELQVEMTAVGGTS